MLDIIFMSRFHKECETCNSNTLLQIIKNIHPDVIFLEVSEEKPFLGSKSF